MNTEITPRTRHAHRARWAAIGAAVAVSLGAGGMGIARATSPTNASAYVAISPCRLLDTRSDPQFHIGDATTLGPDTQLTTNGWGTQGQCTLPADTTSLELNVTAVGATAPTFLTLYPGAGDPPNASHLNPGPGQPPTPNAVTVPLDGAGRFTIFNKNGTVDVIADVVGYYTDHHHDDRYPSKHQSLMIPAPAFTPGNNASVYSDDPFGGAYTTGSQLDAPVLLPVGTTIETVTYYVHDGNASYNLSLALYGVTQPVTSVTLQHFAYTAGSAGDGTVSAAVGHVVAPDTAYFIRIAKLGLGIDTSALTVKGVRIDYTLP